ncbi:DUF1642 domain-containing protein [Enterococcus thailandicus]|uniref:DUF1642 domain-containing protein n=1 Tax=Enterococcus thailandicus TaxID=417368 RepID=UPI0022E23B17|nr:DUF1642 domain-containing protein [Enterococcus thailandicus]
MNKQELIERLHEAGGCGADSETWARGYDDGISVAIDIVEQLDEPQKPVVPKFVADFIEEYRDGGATLYEMMDSSEDEVYTWLFGNPRIETENERQLLFAQAYVVGYEVEKEPLYIMPVPHLSFPVHYCVEDDHISFRQGNAQKFTQAELDKYFPDIKQFAVPVEEVVEG